MNIKTIALSAIVLFCLGITNSFAQQASVSSGGLASGSGGAASYSVGQTVYSASTSGSGSVTQGVQQPYEISEITSIIDNAGIQLNMLVFPNPATDYISIQVNDLMSEKLSYQLLDFSGKIISQDVISENLSQVDMSELSASTYFIKVYQNEKVIKSFKIIKNQEK